MERALRVFIGLVRTMRPRQWTKSLFIFPAIIFDGKLFDGEALFQVTITILLFTLTAGAVYIINDVVDMDHDRQHPRKKYRPIPSGQLSVPIAIVVAAAFPIVSVVVAIALNRPLLAVVLSTYFILQVLYTLALKHIVIIDLLVVTAGFVLRVTAGVVAVEVDNFSAWLYVCSGLLALFLIIGKRRQELVTLGDAAVDARRIFRDYNLPMLDDMLRMVTTSTLIAYILYTIDAPTIKSARLGDASLAMITIPFVLYGLFRYLYLIHVKGEGGAPEEVLLSDRWLQASIVLWGLTFVVLLYLIPQ